MRNAPLASVALSQPKGIWHTLGKAIVTSRTNSSHINTHIVAHRYTYCGQKCHTHLPSVGSNILASMELESAQRVALVVAKTLPPTFSLTQSLRGVPSEDGADTVLRNMKSGTSVEGVREMAL